MDESLRARVEELIDEYSMPEIVVTLIRLSRHYKEDMMREGDGEYQGWIPWEEELTAALCRVEGPDAVDEFDE